MGSSTVVSCAQTGLLGATLQKKEHHQVCDSYYWKPKQKHLEKQQNTHNT